MSTERCGCGDCSICDAERASICDGELLIEQFISDQSDAPEWLVAGIPLDPRAFDVRS